MRYVIITVTLSLLPLLAHADDADALRKASAQAAEVGPAHARLDPLVGSWRTETITHLTKGKDGQPMRFAGAVVRTPVLGKRFLREDYTGTGPDGSAYQATGFLGHDNVTGRYQAVWMSTYGTGMRTYTGTVDPTGKVFTFTGEETNPAKPGAPQRFKTVLTIESPDKHVLTQFYVAADGAETKSFEIVHTRSK